MTDIASLNIRINSLEAKQAKNDLDQLTRSGQQTEKGMGSMSAAARKLGVALAAAFSFQQIISKTSRAVQEFANFERQMLRLEAQIKATGRTGQTTAADMEKMAQAIDKATLQSAQGVRSAQAILMSFRNVSTDMMERILYMAADVSEVMGQDITSAARQMALALEDPERGISMLRRTGTTFTESQKEMIIQLQKAGNELEAQSAILEVMESQYGGTAKAAAEGLAGSMDLLSRNSTNIKIAIGEGLSPVVEEYSNRLAAWIENNQELIAQNVAETVEDTFIVVEKIVTLYDKIPDYVTGPAGLGLVGTALLGSTPGKVIAAIAMINELAGMTGNSLQDLVRKHNESGQAIVNLWNSIAEALGWTKEAAEQTFHVIDQNTEGFGRYSKGADKAGKTTGGLTDNIEDLSEEAKKAAESLKDLQVQSALDNWGFEDLDNYAAHLDEKTEMGVRAEETLAAIRVQQALDSYFEDIDNYAELQQAKTDAEKKAIEDRKRAEEKARREYEREWKRVYDDMHEFAADTFYDIFDGQLDSFEDFADSMLDIFKRMLANMAAEAAMTNIFKPIMNQMAGSALGNMLGLPSLAGRTGGSGTNGLSNLSTARSLYGAYGTYSNYGMAGLSNAYLGTTYTGISTAGGIGLAGGAYQGPGMGAAIAGEYTAGAGSAASSLAAAAPYAAIAAVALPVIMDFVSKKYDDPEYESNITGSLSQFGADLKEFSKVTQDWEQFWGLRSGSQSSWQASSFGKSYSYDDSGRIESVDVNAAIAFNKVLMSVTESVSLYAEEIGQNSEKIKDITKEININTAGMNPDQIMAALEKEFAALGELMAEEVLEGSWKALTDNYQTENALVVLERLALNTIAVKDAFKKLNDGMTITAPKIAGISSSLSKTKITSDLAEMFGGASAFSSSIDSFFKSFYSRDEQIEYFLQTLSDSLPIAIEKIPTTLDAYKEETKRWLETYAATGDRLAGEQFRAFIAFGPEFARLIGDEVNNKTTDLFISALDLLGQDEMSQSATRARVLDDLDESLRPLQEFVWALEDGAERIESATSGLDTVRGTIAGILGGTQTPQSRDFFERRYDTLLEDAQASPENVSAFTDFATQYLDFISDYGDPKGQERVLKDLFGLESDLEDQVSMADEITGGKTLSDLYWLVESSGAKDILPEFSTIVADNGITLGESIYLDALAKFKDAHPTTSIANTYEILNSARSEYEKRTGTRLQFSEQWDDLVKETPQHVYEGETYDLSLLRNIEKMNSYLASQREGPNRAYMTTTGLYEILNKLGMGGYSDDVDNAFEELRDDIGFAGGGSISGPMSGYTVPVTFHGKEHISTDSDMKDVKSLLQAIVSQSQSGNGTVRVYVKVGDSGEFREVVADVMRSDPETQEITRRVVNG
jgi:hypothetical protein